MREIQTRIIRYSGNPNGLIVFVAVHPSDRLQVLVVQRQVALSLGSAPFLTHAGHSRTSHCNPGYFMPGTSCSVPFANLHVSLNEAYAHISKQISCVFRKILSMRYKRLQCCQKKWLIQSKEEKSVTNMML